MAGGSGLGENVRAVFPHRSYNSVDKVNLKLILLTTQDDALEIFFDPRTGEFYTISAGIEDEGGSQDETLVNNASQLAHSVCSIFFEA
jgi:hypothetical protein